MNLLIRVDASRDIGTGHAMRMLALAQAWATYSTNGARSSSDETNPVSANAVHVVFASALITEVLARKINEHGFRVEHMDVPPGSKQDLEQTIRLARSLHDAADGVRWVILDGYGFDVDYQRALRQAGFKVLLVDDYNHQSAYECDVLLNQNIGAEQIAYRVNSDAKKLMGPGFALLRPEFGSARSRFSNDRKNGEQNVPTVGKKLLVTMGGADKDNVTQKIIDVLGQMPMDQGHIKVLLGAANIHRSSLEKAIRHSRNSIELINASNDIPGLMEWADLVITAAGSTCYECMCMGIPMAVVVLADNQADIATCLGERGLAMNLGWFHSLERERIKTVISGFLQDASKREAMSRDVRAIVDGNGAGRVSAAMAGDQFFLRRAAKDDSKWLWECANEYETRKASFHPDKISWTDHQAWFDRRIKDPNTVILIAEIDGVPMGVVRFEVTGAHECHISMSITPAFRGRGVGAQLIQLATGRYARLCGVREIIARIKPINTASIKSFVRAGYVKKGEDVINNQPACLYIWSSGDSLALMHNQDKSFYSLTLIRQFEERVLELFSKGELFGTTHTSIGQEAIAVAAMAQLKPEDIVISNHRCHGHYLARTHDAKGLMAELMGKANGVCAGRGGSQHLCADNFFTNGVQGNMSPVAVGMARAEALKGSGGIVVLFVGDGTFGEGTLYEAMNMASLWSVPLLIVVENNGIAQTTPTTMAMAGTLTGRAAAFGIAHAEIESNDLDLLMHAFRHAVGYVRRESKPFVQIVRTYRLAAHSKGDDHRDPAEIAAWRQRDPVKLLGEKLDPAVVADLTAKAAGVVREAEAFARASAFPALSN